MTRDERQQEALKQWEKVRTWHPLKHARGTIEGATGFGKTRVGLMAVASYPQSANILISVPTQKLRDVDWPTDALKWGVDLSHCTLVCHASLPKIRDQHWDLVVLDEGHHLTYRREIFFDNNHVEDIMCLTATYPEQDDYKHMLLNSIAPSCYKYPLDQAVADGNVADYQIYILQCPLDDKVKHIPGGNKENRFLTTELKHYDYLTKMIQKMKIAKKDSVAEIFIRKRAQFLNNLKYTKTEPARAILKALGEDTKTLVLCGSIDQCNDLMGENVYHSKAKGNAYEKFLSGEIMHLGAVKALDEGVNIPELDVNLIVSSTSEPRRMIQRIGRVLRIREGHIGTVIILVAHGTSDVKWVESALGELDRNKISELPLITFLNAINKRQRESVDHN